MPTYPQEPDQGPQQETPQPQGDLPRPGPVDQAMDPENGPGPDAATDAGPVPDAHAEALEQLQDQWRRAVAELDNLRKRHVRELQRERAAERARTAAALLPVIDNLELALSHAESDPGAIVEGVKAVRDQAVDILERLGFPRHAETGVPFDPTQHEVVGVVENPDAEPGTVVQVLRPGYGDADHQLRPAAVTVAKRE
ncbi:nucleotide exchange factor GrpE [Streptomyces sp. NPDC060064]|uniref:nucleotide exchange factor GrpE n=1 Tax=Streptomyces sp. NPDC060064 TaxID=3347049 RepID=UPI0036864652